MLKMLPILAVLAGLSSANAQPVPLNIPVPGGGTWGVLLNENFTGPNLNLAVWTPNWLNNDPTAITPPVQPDNELAAYDPARCRIVDGFLQLRLIAQPVTVGGQTYPYRTCMVQSEDKRVFVPNAVNGSALAFEARVCSPADGAAMANWPAWWTNGENHPEDGENDIMEGLSGGAAWHYHSAAGSDGDTPEGFDGRGCHTYGSRWQPGQVTYYYDGVLVGVVTDIVVSPPRPHYLILVYATSEEHGGPVMVPATMRVNWARVWRRLP